MRAWNRFKYKYISLLLVGLVFAVFLAGNQSFHDWVVHLGTLEYIGAFFAGILFVSSITVAISAVLIAILSDNIHPLAIALIGGFGAMLGDYFIFRFFKDHISEELALLFGKEGTSYIKHIFRSKYISWMLPLIGAMVIASPLPDELGISLLSLSKVSKNKFLLISFASNAFGILAIASISRVI